MKIKKKIIGNMEWDEKHQEIKAQISKLLDPDTNPSGIADTIMYSKYILDKELDNFERIEGLSNTKAINNFENGMEQIIIDALNEGFEDDEIQTYLERKVKEAIQERLAINKAFQESQTK